MTSIEEQREQWTEASEDVEYELISLFNTRQVWEILSAVMTAKGTDNRATVVDYLNGTYVATICLAVRRQLDTDQKSNSLVRCLQRVVDQPELMNRERFAAMHVAAAGHDFDPNVAFDRYAEPGENVVSARLMAQWVEDLRADTAPVEKYADRVIAHRDRRSAQLLYGEIDVALIGLEKAVKRFWGLAHPGNMLASATPVIELGFLRMFRSPLIDDRFIAPVDPRGRIGHSA
jgi:hypothetical protein